MNSYCSYLHDAAAIKTLIDNLLKSFDSTLNSDTPDGSI